MKGLYRLFVAHRQKLDPELKTPEDRRVQCINQIGGADEQARKAFHAREEFVRMRHLPRRSRQGTVAQKRVRFVQQDYHFIAPIRRRRESFLQTQLVVKQDLMIHGFATQTLQHSDHRFSTTELGDRKWYIYCAIRFY